MSGDTGPEPEPEPQSQSEVSGIQKGEDAIVDVDEKCDLEIGKRDV